MYFTYVLYSKSHNRFYAGMSADISKRVAEHNAGKTKSTKGYRPWELLFAEEFSTRIEARERELYLKTGAGREYVQSYFEKHFGKE
jgi:putative endonuclease